MVEKMFKKSNQKSVKKIFASIMLPMFIFQMSSLNFLFLNVAYATEGEVLTAIEESKSVAEVEEVTPEASAEVLEEEILEEDELPLIKTEVSSEINEMVTEEESAGAVESVKKEADKTEEVAWEMKGEVATISSVKIGEKYVAPQNEGVTVTFSKLPENTGSLTIEEITLTSQQISTLGALTDKAYDITSDMENGTFEYDLTLPKPENENNVQIKFAQDVDGLKEAEAVSDNEFKIKDDEVKVSLDHFTSFVVTTYSDLSLSIEEDEFERGDTVYIGASNLYKSLWYRIDVYDPENNKYNVLQCENNLTSVNTTYEISTDSQISDSWKVKIEKYELKNKCQDREELKDEKEVYFEVVDEEDEEKIKICHANGNDTYNLLELSKDGVLNGHLDHGDIIPPVEDDLPLGQNWEDGESIWNNDCVVPVDSEIIYVDDDNTSGTEDGTEAHPFNTIPEGLAAASNGKEIRVKDGNYILSSTLTIDKEVSIVGESKTGVVINANSVNGYGITNNSEIHNIILKNFTLQGPIDNSSGKYGLKIAHTNNITIENIRVSDSGRSEIDLNTVDGAILKNIEAIGNGTAGVGIALSNSTNITLENISTINNAWGGVGLFDTTEGTTSDVSFEGVNNFNEAWPIYIDEEHGHVVDNIDLPSGYDYAVLNTTFRDETTKPNRSEAFTIFKNSEANAIVLALSMQTVPFVVNSDSYIQTVGSHAVLENNFIVGDGMSIKPAIISASSGADINIRTGVFEEQVSVIGKNLSMKGDGINKTIIKSPEVLNTSFTTSATNKAVVYIKGGDVNIKGLTVDGFSRGNVNYRMMGIAFYNGEGELDEVRATRIENSPADGVQSGNAIYAYNDDETERSVTVKNSKVDHFQKNGITMNGAELTANVTDNDVECYGVIDFIAQNGIQFGWNSTGVIEGNNVSGCSYIKPSDGVYNRASTAILLYDVNSGLNIINNTLTNSDSGINVYKFLSELNIDNNEISDNYWGVAVYDSETDNSINFSGNSFENNTVDLDNYTLDDIDALNTKSWSVDDQENKDQIENVINHNCVSSPYAHGVCNSNDYETGGSVDYWVPDENAPSVPINGAPHDKIIDTNNFDFTWDASIDESTVRYEFQSSLNSAQSDGILTTGLWKSGLLPTNMIHSSGAPDGKWYWQVRAIDEDGNESAWSEIWNVTLDTVAPAKLTINKPMAEQYFTTTPIRNEWRVGSDAGSGIDKYRVWYSYDDNHAFSDSTCGVLNIDGKDGRCRDVDAPATSRNHVPNINEQGGVTIRVQAIDNAGNEGTWSDPVHYFYDATAPAVPTGIYFKDTVNNKNVACGEMTVARNFDVYWNANNEADFDYYEYISFNADGSAGPIRIFKTSYFNASWWTVPIEGVYGVQIRAVDKAGNKSAWFGGEQGRDNSCKYTSDWTRPTTPTIKGFKNPDLSCDAITNIKNITVDWSDSSDANLAGYNYSIDYPLSPGPGRGVWNTFFNSSTSQYSGSLNEGIHYIKVQAKDKAGNVSEWSNICSITYDSILPDVPTLVIPENNSFKKGFPALVTSWNVVPDAVKYIYESYHNKEATNLRWHEEFTTNSKSASNVSEATFWWRVKAVDAAGNESAWSDLWKVTIDNTAPDVEITNPIGEVVSGTVEIRGTVEDNNPHHYWLVIQGPGGQVGPGQVNTNISFINQSLFSWDTTTKADGAYTIKLEARDAADNKDSGSVVWKEVVVDNTEPTSAITYPAGDDNGIVYSNNWDSTVSGMATDNFSGVREVGISIQNSNNEYWNEETDSFEGTTEILNPATILTGMGTKNVTWKYEGLTNSIEGSYTIKSHAVDNAGNREDTYTLTIVFDKTIPEINLAINPNSPDGDNEWYDSIPEISLSATDSVALDKMEYQVDSQSGDWSIYNAPIKIDEGQHIFYYRSLDKAGNYSNVGIKNVKVDTVSPDTVQGLDADYSKDRNVIKLDWRAQDADIYKVHIYRGKHRNFDINSGSRMAENADNDNEITDRDISRGEKYYYKLVSIDEAGNKSDAKVISVEIPETGADAIVTDEGAESVAESAVQSQESTSENQNNEGSQDSNQDGNQATGNEENDEGRVAGAMTSQEGVSQSKQRRTWPYVGLAGAGGLLSAWYLRRRRNNVLNLG